MVRQAVIMVGLESGSSVLNATREQRYSNNLSDWVHFKPKQMRQKTFERLRQVENRTQDAINDTLLAKYGFYM